jgi:DNA modification methylase
VFIFAKTGDYRYNKHLIRVPYKRARDWGKRTWERNPLGADRGDVWLIYHFRGNMSVKGDSYDRSHIAPFPVELVDILMTLGSNEGDLVLDPFGGSGTVLFVAKEKNRDCVSIDIVEDYCKLQLRRIEE